MPEHKMHDFWPTIIEAAKAENSRGIAVRGGKKYTAVAVRLEIARRFLGDTIGVETEIVHYGTEKGCPIVVRATIRNPDGRIIAQGTAEEIRGAGNVNQTSALENAETSALGRALAMLGLSGGEFASANEMDGVERKREAQRAAQRPAEPPHDPETGEITDERNPPPAAPEPPVDHSASHDTDSANLAAWKDGILDKLPATAGKDMKAKALWSQFVDDLDKYKAEKWLSAYVQSRRPVLDWWQASYSDLFDSATHAVAAAYGRIRGEDPADYQPVGTRPEVILGDVKIAG